MLFDLEQQWLRPQCARSLVNLQIGQYADWSNAN